MRASASRQLTWRMRGRRQAQVELRFCEPTMIPVAGIDPMKKQPIVTSLLSNAAQSTSTAATQLTVVHRAETAAPVCRSKLRNPRRCGSGVDGDAETEGETATQEHRPALGSRDDGRTEEHDEAPDEHARTASKALARRTGEECPSAVTGDIDEEHCGLLTACTMSSENAPVHCTVSAHRYRCLRRPLCIRRSSNTEAWH